MMQTTWIASILATTLLVATQSPLAEACTTALLPGAHPLVIKSYDWHTGDGLLVHNPGGLVKSALVRRGQPARWTARYTSMTFNQHGVEFPLGGINERGVVVEIMWLSTADFGQPSGRRPRVNELQLIQRLLDLSASTAEAVRRAKEVEVERVHAKVHYMVCDDRGACATLEYLRGKLKVHQGRALLAPVLTNSTYARSVDHLKQHRGFGGSRPFVAGTSSLQRFVYAARASRVASQRRGDGVVFAQSVLDGVKISGYTKWQIIYEPRTRRVHFRNAQLKTPRLSLTVSPRSCTKGRRVIDLRGSITGRRDGRWRSLGQLNRMLVRVGSQKLQIPAALKAHVAAYPERITCSRAQR